MNNAEEWLTNFEETEKAWKLINSAYKQIYEEKGNSIKYLKNHS